MIRTAIARVTTTGSAGSATGTGYTEAFSGLVVDIRLDFHASAPATTDTTIAHDPTGYGNLIVVTNSATDAVYYPRVEVMDATGTAVTDVMEMYAVSGRLSVALAGCDALTNAVVVYVRYIGN